jgi:hypothetical protein
MLNTTPHSLESINPDILLFVSGGCGGCHKHKCCSGNGPVTQQTVVNMPQVLPQVAQPAAPTAAPGPDPTAFQQPGSFGPQVSTSVSINGQQQQVPQQ